MSSAEYRFITHWKVRGSVSRVFAVLNDVSAYPQWWPQLAREFRSLSKPGTAAGHEKGAITTKGFLPYVLKWNYEVTESKPPHSFSIKAQGDIEGTGRWELHQNGDDVDVTYYWTVRAHKPLLKYFSIFFKPLFARNHDYVMACGKEGLCKELERMIIA